MPHSQTLIQITFVVALISGMAQLRAEAPIQPTSSIHSHKLNRSLDLGLTGLLGRPTPLFYSYTSIQDTNQIPSGASTEAWWIKGGSIDITFYPVALLSRGIPQIQVGSFFNDLGLEVNAGAPWDKQTILNNDQCTQSGLFESCSANDNRLTLFSGSYQLYGFKATVLRLPRDIEKSLIFRINLHGGFAKSFGHIYNRGAALLSNRGIPTGSTSAESWYAKLSVSFHAPLQHQNPMHGGAYISLSILYINHIMDFSPAGAYQRAADLSFPLTIGLQF